VDRLTGRSLHFLHDHENPHSIANYVGNILEDRSGILWLGSVIGNGLSALDLRSQELTTYSFLPEQPASDSVSGVASIHEDADGLCG